MAVWQPSASPMAPRPIARPLPRRFRPTLAAGRAWERTNASVAARVARGYRAPDSAAQVADIARVSAVPGPPEPGAAAGGRWRTPGSSLGKRTPCR